MIGNNIRELRKSRGLTLEELSDELNRKYPNTLNFNKGKLSKWENNKEEPKLSSVRIIADYFEVTVDDLVDGVYDKNIIIIYNKLNHKRKTKVYNFAERQLEEQNRSNVVNMNDYIEEKMSGYLSAGTGEYLSESVNEEIRIPKSIVPDASYDLILQVNGDSMEPMFEDHEYIFVKKTAEIRSGQIGVFIIDNESYLKKAYIEDNRLRLVSLNTKYDDLIFDDVNEVTVVGTVVM